MIFRFSTVWGIGNLHPHIVHGSTVLLEHKSYKCPGKLKTRQNHYKISKHGRQREDLEGFQDEKVWLLQNNGGSKKIMIQCLQKTEKIIYNLEHCTCHLIYKILNLLHMRSEEANERCTYWNKNKKNILHKREKQTLRTDGEGTGMSQMPAVVQPGAPLFRLK